MLAKRIYFVKTNGLARSGAILQPVRGPQLFALDRLPQGVKRQELVTLENRPDRRPASYCLQREYSTPSFVLSRGCFTPFRLTQADRVRVRTHTPSDLT